MLIYKYAEQKKNCFSLDIKQKETKKLNENLQLEIEKLKAELKDLKMK